MSAGYDTTVVAGVLTPLIASFDQAALESLVRFRADEKTQQRFEGLAEKASNGTISLEEQRAYESMVGASSIVAVLQAEAERKLSEFHAESS